MSAAGILFTNGEKVLILKRAPGSSHPHTWGLPGGHIEDGETPLQAAKRECKEEIGKMPYGRHLKTIPEGQWTTFIYKVHQPFTVKLNDEHTKYKWVKFDELKNMRLHPDFKRKIGKYENMLTESNFINYIKERLSS